MIVARWLFFVDSAERDAAPAAAVAASEAAGVMDEPRKRVAPKVSDQLVFRVCWVDGVGGV